MSIRTILLSLFLAVLGFVMTATPAFAQGTPFSLATTGCAQVHCRMQEDGKIGLVPPTAQTGNTVNQALYVHTEGAGESTGCTSGTRHLR